jgi:hypothetical protein
VAVLEFLKGKTYWACGIYFLGAILLVLLLDTPNELIDEHSHHHVQ